MKNGKAKKKKAGGRTVVETVHGIRIREQRPGRFAIQIRRKDLSLYEEFPSLDAARLRAEQLHAEQTRHGLAAFELGSNLRADAKEAALLLNDRATLADAARCWLQQHPDGGGITLKDLAAEYLADMNRRQCRPDTIAGTRIRLNKLAADYGDHPLAAITAERLGEWLDIRSAGQNRNNNRAVFRAAFGYAVKRKWLSNNPAAETERTRIDAKMPEHWDAAKIEAVLRAAQAFNPGMIPTLAVGAFAGLRPSEAARLDWKFINLSERIIRILPGTSKIRQARIVEISDNLAEWLAPHRKKSGPIAPGRQSLNRWRVRLAAASVLGASEVNGRLGRQQGMKGTAIKQQRLGWDSIIEDAKRIEPTLWPTDILRHSSATAWLAANSDIFKLAESMGNSPQVIRAHYKGLMTAKEAAQYWAITPKKSSGKVIDMTA